jgi:hypothetical protein
MANIPLRPLRLAAAKALEASLSRDETIRKYHADGVTIRAIAGCVGLSPARVHQIIHGR